ncbi:fungal specific transcription factor [Seiridium cupressi]
MSFGTIAPASVGQSQPAVNPTVADGTTPTLLGNSSAVPTPSGDEHARRNAYEDGILLLLGLGGDKDALNLVPHVDSEVIYNSLPSNQDMVSLFEIYQLRYHPFHTVTYDIDGIQRKLCTLINTRRQSVASRALSGQVDLRWVCLLHAIFAAGAQSSDLPLERRLSLSQRHTQQAFDLLRTYKFLANPFKEALQTLLLLSYVLQNDMKPQAAWVLQGSTVRLALCLGIHKQTSQSRNLSIPPNEAKQLRLAIVWQDTLVSLMFDRPPASHDFNFREDLPALHHNAVSGTMTYCQGINWISHLGLRYLPCHSSTTFSTSEGPTLVWQDLKLIEANALPHLKDVQACNTIQEIQEYHSFKLHRNFFASDISSDADGSWMPINYLSVTLRKALKALENLRRLADQETSASAQGQTAVPLSDLRQPLERTGNEINTEETMVNDVGGAAQNTDVWASSGWNVPIDFGISPLQTYDYIMSDEYGLGESLQLPFL